MASNAAGASEQELAALYQSKKTELQGLASKVTELEREAEEHSLVIETLREAHDTDPKRKCFRLVGEVLVERTVKDVLPLLESNLDGIKMVMTGLTDSYKKKDTDFQSWQRENNIVVRQR